MRKEAVMMVDRNNIVDLPMQNEKKKKNNKENELHRIRKEKAI